MTTRRRSLSFKGAVGGNRVTKDQVFDNPPSTSRVTYAPFPDGPNGTQVTESENHPGWKRRKAGQASGDIGGDFYTMKQFASSDGKQVTFTGAELIGGFLQRSTKYVGPFVPFALAPGWPPDASSGTGALEVFGTKAIAACKPTNALVDLSTTLGELLKDGAPSRIGAELWESSAARLKNSVGSEYLNVEFGWKPLVADIQKTMDAIIRADAVIRQYKRDAGKVVRRRLDLSPTNSRSDTISHNNVNAFALYDGSELRKTTANKGQVLRTRETSVKRWFSGAFSYHLPLDVGGNPREVSKAKEIFGLELTPSTLWNLSPWSWAVDWFVPVGDLLGNLQDWASDGQVLLYGYIMEHSIVRDTYTFIGDTGFLSPQRPSILTYTTEVKKRRRATPFGFGLSWDRFTDRQLAIAAALGLSRS